MFKICIIKNLYNINIFENHRLISKVRSRKFGVNQIEPIYEGYHSKDEMWTINFVLFKYIKILKILERRYNYPAELVRGFKFGYKIFIIYFKFNQFKIARFLLVEYIEYLILCVIKTKKLVEGSIYNWIIN